MEGGAGGEGGDEDAPVIVTAGATAKEVQILHVLTGDPTVTDRDSDDDDEPVPNPRVWDSMSHVRTRKHAAA
jgi:hypothetical protein